MNPSSLIATVLLAILVLANLAVSVAVARTHYYSRRQKLVQVLLVWLLPLIGAVGIGVFLYSQRDNTMFDTRAVSGQPFHLDFARPTRIHYST